MKFHSLLFALTLLTTGAANAALVDFSTTSAVLSCGTAANCSPGTGNVINFAISPTGSATLQITYSANIENDLNVNPLATTNFGQLFLLCVSCAGQTGSFDLSGATLTLNVSQGPDPFPGNGTFGVGDLSGTLSLANGAFGGTGQVAWDVPAQFQLVNGSQVIGYTLQQPSPPTPPAYFLSINAATTLQGFVTETVLDEVPEPATTALIAFGLMGIGLIGRGARQR